MRGAGWSDRTKDSVFRREERRDLVSERGYRRDLRLLVCLLLTSSLLFISAVLLILIYFLYAKNYEAVKPLVVVGGVFILAGLAVMICTVEVACR